MTYIFAALSIFLLLTFENQDKVDSNKDLAMRFCASLVWPLLALFLALYWKDEIVAKALELLSYVDVDLKAFYLIAKDLETEESPYWEEELESRK